MNSQGIRILADRITELEAHPPEPDLVRGASYYQGLERRAKYDASFPAPLKRLVRLSQTSNVTLRRLGGRLIDFDPMFSVTSGTTQAFGALCMEMPSPRLYGPSQTTALLTTVRLLN